MPQEVTLLDDPGKDQLSKDIIEKLREVGERYQDMDEWDLMRLVAARAAEEPRAACAAGGVP